MKTCEILSNGVWEITVFICSGHGVLAACEASVRGSRDTYFTILRFDSSHVFTSQLISVPCARPDLDVQYQMGHKAKRSRRCEMARSGYSNTYERRGVPCNPPPRFHLIRSLCFKTPCSLSDK